MAIKHQVIFHWCVNEICWLDDAISLLMEGKPPRDKSMEAELHALRHSLEIGIGRTLRVPSLERLFRIAFANKDVYVRDDGLHERQEKDCSYLSSVSTLLSSVRSHTKVYETLIMLTPKTSATTPCIQKQVMSLKVCLRSLTLSPAWLLDANATVACC